MMERRYGTVLGRQGAIVRNGTGIWEDGQLGLEGRLALGKGRVTPLVRAVIEITENAASTCWVVQQMYRSRSRNADYCLQERQQSASAGKGW